MNDVATIEPPSNLKRYRSAIRALEVAATIDEVKNVRDQSLAMELYAYQSKDAQLVSLSTEVKNRATRKLGELMEKLRQAGKLDKGGRPKTGFSKNPVTLAEQGVDKNLAHAARAAAKLSPEKFEAKVAKDARLAVAVVHGQREVIREAKVELHEKAKTARAKREREMAAKIKALPRKSYGVIYADPEWRFETWSEKGLSRAPDKHYATSDLDEIKRRKVGSIAAKDCVLFLWATVPMLPQALDVMKAWGFAYVTHFAWIKDRAATGYWNRGKHELLLVGTKGDPPAPAQGTQWESVIVAKKGKHSQKPDAGYELIERYFPSLPRIELNARKARKGWDRWGAEAP